jgi:hypothetical protein
VIAPVEPGEDALPAGIDAHRVHDDDGHGLAAQILDDVPEMPRLEVEGLVGEVPLDEVLQSRELQAVGVAEVPSQEADALL